jgi:hypothetical protein
MLPRRRVGADEVVLLNRLSSYRCFIFRADSGGVLRPAKVDVHELIAWALDEYPYRSSTIGPRPEDLAKQVERAQQRLTEREPYEGCPALLAEETESIRHLLTANLQRADLQEEYEGLDWALGVVDLRLLLAFQRRLVFDSAQCPLSIPQQDDWSHLISLAFGSRKDTRHRIICNGNTADGLDLNLYSSNPDLQLRLNPKAGHSDLSPLSLYGGSPFFEVAELRGRWFLRDGYHRAYRLLQAGVHRMPAVVIRTRTLRELGATEPWFFSEDQLFSDRPPRVMDFLDESLVLRYERAALRKVIRIRIEESLQPFNETDEVQGETL